MTCRPINSSASTRADRDRLPVLCRRDPPVRKRNHFVPQRIIHEVDDFGLDRRIVRGFRLQFRQPFPLFSLLHFDRMVAQLLPRFGSQTFHPFHIFSFFPGQFREWRSGGVCANDPDGCKTDTGKNKCRGRHGKNHDKRPGLHHMPPFLKNVAHSNDDLRASSVQPETQRSLPRYHRHSR